MEPKIRVYEEGDFKSVLRIFQLNTPAFFSPEEEKHLIYYLNHETELYFVMELNNHIIGSGGINFRDDQTTAVISWDFLHPDYHGRGLGRTLLKYRLNRIKELNISNVIVRTSQHTFRFYEKNGFQLQEIVKDHWAPGFDLYRMHLKE